MNAQIHQEDDTTLASYAQDLTNKPRILLVEDHHIIQKSTTLLLNELNCEVTLASCGKEAIDFFKDDFDLILLDIGLPDMEGYDVSKYIRESDFPYSKKVPIIGHTAHNISTVIERCCLSGMNTAYNKITSSDEFYEMLMKYLPKKFHSFLKKPNTNIVKTMKS